MDPLMIPILVIMCLSLLADVCFTVLFLRYPALREGPGQLILAQTQAQIFIDLHWVTLSSARPGSNPVACQIVGFFGYSGFMCACAYTAAICIAVKLNVNRRRYSSLWKYHTAVLVFSLGFCVIVGATDGLGESAFYVCSLRSKSWSE